MAEAEGMEPQDTDPQGTAPDGAPPAVPAADEFQADPVPPASNPPAEDGTLVLEIDGYEGPLDILLTLARQQKVDLRKISILALAEQYLVFVTSARRIHLDLAADYLVMAAWLAYLKSRLLVPEPEVEEGELSAAELAGRLALRLQRLEAMRKASAALMARPRIGLAMFGRGMPEGIRIVRTSIYSCALYDLLKAYGEFKGSRGPREALTMKMGRARIVSIEEALERLRRVLGDIPDWTVLQSFLPEDMADPLTQRSAIASTLSASLEMAKRGEVDLRQLKPFGPIYVKRAAPREDSHERNDT